MQCCVYFILHPLLPITLVAFSCTHRTRCMHHLVQTRRRPDATDGKGCKGQICLRESPISDQWESQIPDQWESQQAGFQISLNYKKIKSKWVPNSSRIPNECDLLCAWTFQCICSFSCFLASARRVALVLGGRLGKVRPALRKAGRIFSLRGKFPYISPLFLCARAEI